MKISELKQAYYDASETLSTLVRQLSLAGIAVIWIFKIGKDNSAGIPFSPVMRGSLLLFVLALSCDLLQYIYKSAIWWLLNNHHWKKHRSDDVEVEISEKFNYLSNIFFWSKAIICLAAYGGLFLVLYPMVMKSP